MKRALLGASLVLLLTSLGWADGLILNDGRKVIGKVTQKPDGYEVNVEGQVVGYAKDQVSRWIKEPKDILGDADTMIRQAKDIYSQAVEMKDDKVADARFRDALPLVTRARELYAEARDFFPDGYSELDSGLVNIMKLMRLVRERLGSQIASGGAQVVKAKDAPPPPPPPPPKPVMRTAEPPPPPPAPVAPPAPPKSVSIAEALAILVDPAKRADEGHRRDARAQFRQAWEAGSPFADAAAAGYILLSRDDNDWLLVSDSVSVKASTSQTTYVGKMVKRSDTLSALVLADRREVRVRKAADGTYVTPPGGSEFKALDCKVALDQKTEAFQTLQDFFAGLGAEKLEQLSEPEIIEGVTFLGRKVKEFRMKQADAPVEPLRLFASGLASSLIAKAGGKPVKEFEAAFRDLGFDKSEYGAVWGEKKNLAIDDFRKWMASGEYGLGVVQLQTEYRNATEFATHYAIGLLMTFRAVLDNRSYSRAAAYFEGAARNAASTPVREHYQALARSIREHSPCPACGGTHAVNCTACKGKTKVTLQCNKCGGSGAINTLNGVKQCPGCTGQGTFRNVNCPKCSASGKAVCRARGCTKAVSKPTFESFAEAYACPLCKNRGSLLKHVAYPCPECFGIGMVIQPRSDPAKMLK